MPATRPTTIQERQEMARLSEAHETQKAVAEQLGVAFWTARKWIRRAKHGGLAALVSVRGRPANGPLAGFDPRVRYVALRLKRQHLKWGAAYIVMKMSERPSLQGLVLPEATTVWRYWRSFGTRLFPARQAVQPRRPPAGVAHGVWQLDFKESVPIPGVGATTFAQARDEFGRATVMHRVHPAATPQQRIVKLTIEQVRHDCRIAFTQWGLPDAIQTDHADIFVEADASPFPTMLRLWWTGLGIEHRLIPRHTPQRNGSVERSHRTLDERTLQGSSFQDARQLQTQVDADWQELNAECPSRARGCQGKPPLLAHPELSTPRRAYRPEWERELFDPKRVYAHLADMTWVRTVSQVGQVRLAGHRYGVGSAWAGLSVSIHFDSEHQHYVFTPLRPAKKGMPESPVSQSVSRPAQRLTLEALTGLAADLQTLPTRQLMLPFAFSVPQPIAPQARLSATSVTA